MLLLIAAAVLCAMLYRKNLRLEGAPEAAQDPEVRAFVDGKPVKSYVRE